MKFIAYMAFNNNGDVGSELKGKQDYYTAVPVKFLDSGAVLFKNDPHELLETSLAYFKNLQQALLSEFGTGISVAVAPSSDCSAAGEIQKFCQAMKRLDPNIVTIVDQGASPLLPDPSLSLELASEWKRQQYKSQDVLSKDSSPLHPGIDYAVSFSTKNYPNKVAADLVRQYLQAKPNSGKVVDAEVIRWIVATAYASASIEPPNGQNLSGPSFL